MRVHRDCGHGGTPDVLESTCLILRAPLVPLDFPSSLPQLSFSPSYFYLYPWAVTGSVCPPASQLCKGHGFCFENSFQCPGPRQSRYLGTSSGLSFVYQTPLIP